MNKTLSWISGLALMAMLGVGLSYGVYAQDNSKLSKGDVEFIRVMDADTTSTQEWKQSEVVEKKKVAPKKKKKPAKKASKKPVKKVARKAVSDSAPVPAPAPRVQPVTVNITNNIPDTMPKGYVASEAAAPAEDVADVAEVQAPAPVAADSVEESARIDDLAKQKAELLNKQKAEDAARVEKLAQERVDEISRTVARVDELATQKAEALVSKERAQQEDKALAVDDKKGGAKKDGDVADKESDASSKDMKNEFDVKTQSGLGFDVQGLYYQNHVKEKFKDRALKPSFGVSIVVPFTGSVFAKLDGRYSFGAIESHSVDPASSDSFIEPRLSFGTDIAWNKVAFTPYVGFGDRYAMNDNRNYKVSENFYYVFAGLQPRFKVGDHSRIALTAEYDRIVGGDYSLSPSSRGFEFAKFSTKLNSGYGAKASVMYETDSWAFGPFVNYWNIAQSSIIDLDTDEGNPGAECALFDLLPPCQFSQPSTLRYEIGMQLTMHLF